VSHDKGQDNNNNNNNNKKNLIKTTRVGEIHIFKNWRNLNSMVCKVSQNLD
jgi:hypothetical protein